MQIERRSFALDEIESPVPLLAVEKRSEPVDEGGEPQEREYIVGYGAKFGVLSLDLGDFVERIDPSAFSLVTERRGRKKKLETRALFNHDANYPLARYPETLRITVDAISFSAHADYPQTQQFLDALAPPHVVLVHGEAGEMGKLKRALEGKATADGKKMMVYNPKNCQAVEIKHSQSKTARVMGKLALNPPKNGERVSGLLVQKDFGHMIIAPEDLHEYTRLKTAKLIQKQKVPTTQKMGALRFALEALFEGIHTVSSWDPDAAPEAEP